PIHLPSRFGRIHEDMDVGTGPVYSRHGPLQSLRLARIEFCEYLVMREQRRHSENAGCRCQRPADYTTKHSSSSFVTGIIYGEGRAYVLATAAKAAGEFCARARWRPFQTQRVRPTASMPGRVES